MTIRARKRFGQHFLHDRAVIDAILDAIELQPDQTLIEIGPGAGALTGPLLAHVPALHVIEIDRDLAGLLAERYGETGKLIIHREDVLKIDFCSRFHGRLNVVGNLPYNISTPLLFHLLGDSACIDRMTFMVQKEVADRICAEPGNSDYGRLSIMVQSACEVARLLHVGPGAFHPPPKVDSAVIRLTPLRQQNIILDRELFADLVRNAFSKRRKTIRNALKSMVDEQLLESAGVSPSSRPEEIPVRTWVELGNIVSRHRLQNRGQAT